MFRNEIILLFNRTFYSSVSFLPITGQYYARRYPRAKTTCSQCSRNTSRRKEHVCFYIKEKKRWGKKEGKKKKRPGMYHRPKTYRMLVQIKCLEIFAALHRLLRQSTLGTALRRPVPRGEHLHHQLHPVLRMPFCPAILLHHVLKGHERRVCNSVGERSSQRAPHHHAAQHTCTKWNRTYKACKDEKSVLVNTSTHQLEIV